MYLCEVSLLQIQVKWWDEVMKEYLYSVATFR